MILDGIRRSSRKKLRDLRPLVPELGVCFEDFAVLLFAPVGLFDLRIEVVEVPLAALLSNPPGKILRNIGPFPRPELRDQRD